jgi:hypothetical protein
LNQTCGPCFPSQAKALSLGSRALGVCALSARPTVDVVSSVIGPRRARGGLREAADAGVVEVDGGELAFAHPLLTAAACNSMTLAKRRALHRRLAAVVDDPEPRGRHLALAADGRTPLLHPHSMPPHVTHAGEARRPRGPNCSSSLAA